EIRHLLFCNCCQLCLRDLTDNFSSRFVRTLLELELLFDQFRRRSGLVREVKRLVIVQRHDSWDEFSHAILGFFVEACRKLVNVDSVLSQRWSKWGSWICLTTTCQYFKFYFDFL